MNTTALRLSPLALVAILTGSVTWNSQAQTTAYTDPVGYYTMSIAGSSDNVMSLPMVRDAVFAGTVAAPITSNSFSVLAGTVAPTWTTSPKQWVYAAGAQRLHYYVEFTSGNLKGLYYMIADNAAASLTLDTEGDDLLSHSINGSVNPNNKLVAGDSFKIRPYWTIKDVFEVNGTPIVDARPDFDSPKDDILMPNYITVGVNKAAGIAYYYLNSVADGVGWRSVGTEPADKADDILRPNEAFVVRRRNAASISLTNLGSVQMIRTISFIPGGNVTKGNDTYISINRPASVTLNQSGLHNADQTISVIKDSPDGDNPTDRLYAFVPGAGFNRAPGRQYYYLNGPDGTGWRLFPDLTTDVGGTLLDPGVAYIVRKTSTPTGNGRDWINDPNY